MIVRVLKATVRAGRIGAFTREFRNQLALLQEQPGLAYVKLARRTQPDGSQELVLLEEWRDAASLYAWVGPDLMEPRLVPGARAMIDELVVSHYEALADASEADDASGHDSRSSPPDPALNSPGGPREPLSGAWEPGT